MRVLFLTPDLFGPPGGIARVSRLICKALSESTTVKQLDILALNDVKGQNVDPYYLPTTNYSYTPMGRRKAQFIKQVLGLAVRRYDIYLTSHINLAWPLWCIRCLYHYRSVCVSVVHGIDVWNRLPWFRRFPLINSSVILSVSNLTKERMIQANEVSQEKVRILPNCLDPSFTSTTEPNAKSDTTNLEWVQKPFILTVSRLTQNDRYKGHTQVIHALARIRQQFPMLTYYLVGEGDLIPELQQLCEQLNVASAVYFCGRVDEETLSRLYADAEIFVMPSKGEGFGLVYLEAMAHGLPVIASNQDAAGEVVQHDKTGLLVDPDDIEALSTSLVQLLTNPALRKNMGILGQQVAKTNFSYSVFKDNLLRYLQDAISNSN